MIVRAGGAISLNPFATVLFTFLTSMLKTALKTNIIPHIWKLANIVPIPKPNKDIHKGTWKCTQNEKREDL